MEPAMNRRNASNREFIERWRRAAPILERIRKQELRNFDYKKNWKIIDALLQLGVDFAVERKTSGLIELQRLLHKRDGKSSGRTR
jgi:hypothetical protein